MEAPLVEFRDVVKRFGDKTVLNGINLRIYENRITTIIGKSGSGKSVLLKHIIGLLKPDEGVIIFQGKPVHTMKKSEWNEYRSRVSYLFQDNALFDSMSVFENIALPLRQTTNLKKKEIESRVMQRIGDLELSEAAGKYPSELSGGMQKRVALARALVTNPKIVLFDEPTTGQDPIRKNVILSMIAHYRRKFGFTAVLISHDIPDVYFISDRIILLWEGKVGFEGSYDELAVLKHPLVDEFLRSLEGFRDELTGLLSKEVFQSRYASTLGAHAVPTVSAALFSVEFDRLNEALGPQAAVAVVSALGEYANRYFSALGGFSARQSRDQILTIFPHATVEEARKMVGGFGKKLEEEAIAGIRDLTGVNVGVDHCFEVYVRAGITEVSPGDEIKEIIEKAAVKQDIVATHRCEFGGTV
ncbi:MAG: ATP-binding cassette domain-containing protein [Syntrophorhabdus aromaticivorans]|uniref:ATP-binding cassette domain-containing protein n=1 Tax=Syntrophorhabdus aromaticivorans TaxID=328301 RepID=A0A351U5S9_9BACT|nr:ATP-binding cassette domain-containing protein [Syntrophorhabdus aromaticivorans]HBA55310.1 diguanylate cyclase [Syntrophorhabdus aromaticivorans]